MDYTKIAVIWALILVLVVGHINIITWQIEKCSN